MENNTFKSVAFGGFAKQDVIDYIERTARESAAAQEKLQQENNELHTVFENGSFVKRFTLNEVRQNLHGGAF